MITDGPPAIGLSEADRTRVESIEALARAGESSVAALIELLDDPSWGVRRAVVLALSRAADPAVAGLCELLRSRRGNEARLAAAVDALAASSSDPTAALLALTESEVAAVACDGLQILGRRKAHAALPRIALLGAHADDNVAAAAIEAMGRIGGHETVVPLVAAVLSRNFFRTFPAIDALGRTGDPRAIEPLTLLLDDPFYAAEATRALGRTGLPLALAGLGRMLGRPSLLLVRTAAIALSDLRDSYEAKLGDGAPLVRELEKVVSALPAAVSPRVSGAIAGAAPSEQVALARLLGWLGDEGAIASLIELLDAEGAVATAAADALRGIGPDAAPFVVSALGGSGGTRRARLLPLVGQGRGPLSAIAACLEDDDPEVRALACDALARAGDASVVPALFRLLGDPVARVSQASVAALLALGSPETTRLALLEARSLDPRARRAALRILSFFGETGEAEGLDALVLALGDPDARTREAAIQGLPRFHDKRALVALLSATADDAPKLRAAAMRALGSTTDAADVVAALLGGLGDSDPWTRYYACQSLAKLRVREATDAIIARIDDEAGQVRLAAVEALAHLGSDRALAALAVAAGSPDDDVRRGALLGLGIAGQPGSMPLLRKALMAPDPATRLVALSAIAAFDLPDVVPLLAQALFDPDESVRGAAIGSLSARPGHDATEVLLQQLGNPLFRDRIVVALAVAPDLRIEGIVAALERADSELAYVLMSALTRMGRASSFAAVLAALASENVHARRAAIAALGAIGTPEAVLAVRRAVDHDPDSEVRRIGTALLRE